MRALINDEILDPGEKVLTFDYMVSPSPLSHLMARCRVNNHRDTFVCICSRSSSHKILNGEGVFCRRCLDIASYVGIW